MADRLVVDDSRGKRERKPVSKRFRTGVGYVVVHPLEQVGTGRSDVGRREQCVSGKIMLNAERPLLQIRIFAVGIDRKFKSTQTQGLRPELACDQYSGNVRT